MYTLRSKLNNNTKSHLSQEGSMLMFRLDPFAVLLNSIPVLSQIGQQADIKCTTNRLTLMLSHSAPPFIAAIQMSPEFFNLYDSDHTYHFRFSLDRFYVIMYQMELQGFSSMLFNIMNQIQAIFLTFERNSSNYSFSSLHIQSCFLYYSRINQESSSFTPRLKTI